MDFASILGRHTFKEKLRFFGEVVKREVAPNSKSKRVLDLNYRAFLKFLAKPIGT
tara:strand:- start:282 stop:446 length:165 start_codon:yes stop_codon:yes gene_type:complete